MNARLADVQDLVGPAQHAGRGAADLHMRDRTDRRQQELRVEGRHFEHADLGHAELCGRPFDAGLADPAVLFLRPHQ